MRKSRILQASIIVSLILVSSAIFLSQADKLFGKAQATRITGTIVLTDHLLNTRDYTAQIYLPGSGCTGVVNYCYTDGTTANSFCRIASLAHVAGNKYAVNLPPESTVNTASVGCSGYGVQSTTITQTGSYIDASAYCALSGSGGGTSAIWYCGDNGVCGTVSSCSGNPWLCSSDSDDTKILVCSMSSTGSQTVTQRFAYAPGARFMASCYRGSAMSSSATISDKVGLPQPATHVSVSYEC